MIRLSALAFASLLSGCASSLQVTYLSDPPGATIYQNGRRLGYAPQTLTYDVTKEEKETGSMRIRGTTARWASGATDEVKELTTDFRTHGFNPTYTHRRPSQAPGYEIDAKFALELTRTRAAQRLAAEQAEEAAMRRKEERERTELMRRQTDAMEAQTRQQSSPRTCRTTTWNGEATTVCN